MQAELSQETFETRMTDIGGYTAYVDWKEECPAVLLVLHQHLGVANYLRVMAQILSDNKLSIVIPSYFPQSESSDAQSHSQDDSNYLKTLNQETIARRILDIYKILLTQKKAIVLVGFSLGSAVGLKMLEMMEEIKFAMLFYGIPPLKGARASKLKCPVTLYVGEKDQIRGLSDDVLVQKAMKVYGNNQYVEIVSVKGAKHGFMNPSCPHYSEKTFKQCSKAFQKRAKTAIAEAKEQLKKEQAAEAQQNGKKGKEQDEKKQDDGCQLI